MMDDFVAYPSRWRTVLAILLALGFVSMGLSMVGVFGASSGSPSHPDTETVVIGWAGTVLFGSAAIIFVWNLIEGRLVLRIGRSGIHPARWTDETIPWSEIVDVRIWKLRGQKMIVLRLRNPDRFRERALTTRFVRANRWLTGGDIAISLAAADRSVAEAMSAIERFRPVMRRPFN